MSFSIFLRLIEKEKLAYERYSVGGNKTLSLSIELYVVWYDWDTVYAEELWVIKE